MPVEKHLFLPPSPLFQNSDTSQGFSLWPTPVSEYPVSFLRFARELYKRLNVSSDFIWRMEYRNLKGCVMPPYIPGNSASLESPRAYDQQQFEPREFILTNEWALISLR